MTSSAAPCTSDLPPRTSPVHCSAVSAPSLIDAAVQAERDRIMRDLHDHLGHHLANAVALVHAGAPREMVAAALDECVDHLRLTLDSVTSGANHPDLLLSSWRHRLAERLEHQGLELDWQVDRLPRLAGLTPESSVHLLRILQEACTNIVKHARARRIRIESLPDGSGGVHLRVVDDGHGMQAACQGHGLSNMRHRAGLVGGVLEIVTGPTGTTLDLHLPCTACPAATAEAGSHAGDAKR